MHGAAGTALCLAYLATARQDVALADAAVGLINRSTEGFGGAPRSPHSLARGATGLSWVIEHLRMEFLWAAEDDPSDHFDHLVADHVDMTSDGDPLGLLEGVSGMGLYFIERLANRPLPSVLERILLCLAVACDSRMGFGHTWWTPPAVIPEAERAARPFGHYDLGVAYGIPGIIGFLGQLAALGVGHSLVTGILRRAVPWVLSKRLNDGRLTLPRFSGTNVPAGAMAR